LSDDRLFETATFRRDLEMLGPEASRRLRATLEKRVYPVLSVTPRQAPGAARLGDWEPPTWRIRIGSWRVFYEINDEKRIVSLTVATQRREAYR
jgi:mRNA interferase RelE/StbE